MDRSIEEAHEIDCSCFDLGTQWPTLRPRTNESIDSPFQQARQMVGKHMRKKTPKFTQPFPSKKSLRRKDIEESANNSCIQMHKPSKHESTNTDWIMPEKQYEKWVVVITDSSILNKEMKNKQNIHFPDSTESSSVNNFRHKQKLSFINSDTSNKSFIFKNSVGWENKPVESIFEVVREAHETLESEVSNRKRNHQSDLIVPESKNRPTMKNSTYGFQTEFYPQSHSRDQSINEPRQPKVKQIGIGPSEKHSRNPSQNASYDPSNNSSQAPSYNPSRMPSRNPSKHQLKPCTPCENWLEKKRVSQSSSLSNTSPKPEQKKPEVKKKNEQEINKFKKISIRAQNNHLFLNQIQQVSHLEQLQKIYPKEIESFGEDVSSSVESEVIEKGRNTWTPTSFRDTTKKQQKHLIISSLHIRDSSRLSSKSNHKNSFR